MLAKFSDDPSFDARVACQRYAFKKGTLREVSRQRLDAVGPGWSETVWPV